jgi:D-sedoheptulose 7-phosphate isomerase
MMEDNMNELISQINNYLADAAKLLERLDRQAIAKAGLLLKCYARQGRVWTLGNGGSASTAQHFACDLAKFVIPSGERPFDAHSLTDNVSLYTAWANDAARTFSPTKCGDCSNATTS